MSKHEVVRISGHLIGLIDKAIGSVKDDFGANKYKNRRDFIDHSVEAFLRKQTPGLLPVIISEVPAVE